MNSKAYCQFKYACSYDFFPENILLKSPREKSTTTYSYSEFYVEEYSKFEDLIDRIDELYSLFVKDFSVRGIDLHSTECSYPEFVVKNSYESSIVIGVSASG